MKKNEKKILDLSLSFKIASFITFYFALAVVKTVNFFYYGLRVKDKSNLKAAKKAVLVSNHSLFWDPAILSDALWPRRTYFTLLESTVKAPLLGLLVRLLGGIPVPGKNGIIKLERYIELAVNDRGSVHFFPEGECYLWSQEISAFFPGAFYFAVKCGFPVIPAVNVLRARKIFGLSGIRLFGKVFHVPPQVTTVIAPPIHPEGHKPGHAEDLDSRIKDISDRTRIVMQGIIDQEKGSKEIFRGKMRRLIKDR